LSRTCGCRSASGRGKKRSALALLSALALCVSGRASGEDHDLTWAKKPWPKGADKQRFYLVGHAHIDPVWLWPWSEGVAVTLSTFRSMLDRMKEDPSVTVVASSAQHYAWVAEQDPAMLEEIRRRVKEGRWELAGGWWVEADANLPSGESLARQGLLGQRTLQRLFGRTATVGFAPDTFGHAITLPQILKLQGLDSYLFARPDRGALKLPRELFWWESPDGSRVLGYRIPAAYGLWQPQMEGRLKRLADHHLDPSRTLLAFYGIGDHGGGPSREQLASIHRMEKQRGAPRLQMSTPGRYLEEVRRTVAAKDLPVVRQELNPVFVGCYTAESSIKQGNREAEAALVAAERLAAVASVTAGLPYPGRELEAAWQRVLFLQFHDSLPGTSLAEHYRAARDAHGLALQVARETLYRAAQRLAWQVPTSDPASSYLVVFNPHAWPAQLDVEYELDWPRTRADGKEASAGESLLEDERGRPVPHQWVAPGSVTGPRNRLAARVLVPALGYRQLRQRIGPPRPLPPVVRVDERGLENALLKVSLLADGSLALLDKRSGRQAFAAGQGLRALVLEDRSSTWGHDVRAYDKVLGAFRRAGVQVIERGPLRSRLRVQYAYGSSRLSVDWVLRAGVAELEGLVTLDWHEQQKLLKLTLPLELAAPRATYEAPFGHVERPLDGGEVPAQRWADVSGTCGGKACGLALLTDAKHGFSAKGSELRLTVVRGAPYAHHPPRALDLTKQIAWQDQGRQSFRLLVVPHAGTWREAGIARRAEELSAPVPVLYQGIHGGKRPQAASFVEVGPASVVVTAVKQAEDGDDLIVRLVETAGQATLARLKLPLLGRSWEGKLRRAEIKTLRIPRKGGPIVEVDLLERAAPLTSRAAR